MANYSKSADLKMLERLVDKLTDRVTDLMAVQKEQERKINELVSKVNELGAIESVDPWDVPNDDGMVVMDNEGNSKRVVRDDLSTMTE